jgi:RNA polymerase sigma-70 factor (ECF subfamily)
MLRLARSLLGRDALAAEVVQDTWEIVLQQLMGFRGESSVRTWIYTILVHRARRIGPREARSLPFSSLVRPGDEGAGEIEGVDEFLSHGKWASPVHGWRMIDPLSEAMTREALTLLGAALERLPAAQRAVVTLRDLEGLDSDEVCRLLELTEINQRTLLHRGRQALRRALEAAERQLDPAPAGKAAAGGADVDLP